MQKIGFIGAGKMAEAIIDGLLINSFTSNEIGCFSPGQSAFTLSEHKNVKYYADPIQLAKNSSTVVLACKPQHLPTLDSRLNKTLENRLLISVLAGVSLQELRKKFPQAGAIVRLMPNTPVQIGQGMNCFCSTDTLSPNQARQLKDFLQPLGTNFEISEDKLDDFMAVWACGPAYVFEFIGGLVETAKGLGFESSQAIAFSKQMVHGAAALAFKSNKSPEDLKNAVASKGGATQAGLDILSKNNFRKTLQDTALAAKNHASQILAKQTS